MQFFKRVQQLLGSGVEKRRNDNGRRQQHAML
jgi:hypothetical protein